jgi:hypothetical protein
MTVTIVETPTQARAITGGVDTHADVHVAAALDPIGGLLGVQEFPATPNHSLTRTEMSSRKCHPDA